MGATPDDGVDSLFDLLLARDLPPRSQIFKLPVDGLVDRFISAISGTDPELRLQALLSGLRLGLWLGDSYRLKTPILLPSNRFSLYPRQIRAITSTLWQIIETGDDAKSFEAALNAGFGFDLFEGVESVSKLIKLLQSSAPTHVAYRSSLVYFLDHAGRDAASAAVPVLINLLEDPQHRVRADTLVFLGWLEDESREAVPAIVSLAVCPGADEELVKPDFFHKLCTDDPSAAESINRFLARSLRVKAAVALVRIDPEGERILKVAASDEAKETLVDLLREVGEMGRKLRKLLEDARSNSGPGGEGPPLEGPHPDLDTLLELFDIVEMAGGLLSKNALRGHLTTAKIKDGMVKLGDILKVSKDRIIKRKGRRSTRRGYRKIIETVGDPAALEVLRKHTFDS